MKNNHNIRGFAFVEMPLVALCIILILVLVTPVLGSSSNKASTVQCMADKKQIVIALYTYAADNDQLFPSRNAESGYGYPHQLVRNGEGGYDLSKTFVDAYLHDRSVLFCPNLSMSKEGINSDWINSQYHVFPTNNFWKIPRPDLSGVEAITGKAPLWSCYARVKNKIYTSHAHDGIEEEPKGMVTAYSDGSGEFVPWQDTEVYWGYGTESHYWPKYRQ